MVIQRPQLISKSRYSSSWPPPTTELASHRKIRRLDQHAYIYVKADDMLRIASTLYFADYYCMYGESHYVTLVMTKPGSKAECFCAERLMLLNVNDATEIPFLFYDHLGQLKVSTAQNLWVEILLTEDIDIRRGIFQHDLLACGKGSSTPGGIPKDPECPKCNISRFTGLQKF